MKPGQGERSRLNLLVVPPPQEDELISSWLSRVADFHGQPLQRLLREIGGARDFVATVALDVGRPRNLLRPAAAVLGIDVAQLARQTLLATYPWAVRLLAGAPVQSHDLRYAACAHCQEEQRLSCGVMWLRRAWVLAPRTVCAVHHLPLEEVNTGDIAHPVWARYAGRNRKISLSTYIAVKPWQDVRSGAPTSAPTDVDHTGMTTRLRREIALVEEALLNLAASRKRARAGKGQGRAVIVRDLLWAFTRADRHAPDRLLYEACASEYLDRYCFMSRRRRAGPADFARLSLESRHAMIATATVLTGDLPLI